MKKYFILAAAALSFAACSSDDEFAPKQEAQSEQAIEFNAYVGRGTTRAGAVGTITNSDGSGTKKLLQATGFGVFGYYTDGKPYSETAIPNFMYNQLVSGGGSWNYSPLKYWPNEFGTDATSDDKDMLTFFAYAPYVAVNPGTGRVTSGSNTSGIVGLTSNTATGDPYVKYYVDFDPENRVDLLYGVAKEAWATTDGVVSGIGTAITVGNPFIDLVKPTTGKKVYFDFKHALASLNVTIDAFVDGEDATNDLDKNTRIWVRSVTFEGFTDKGSLNLNSVADDPLWYELSSTNTRIGSGVVTIYDQRRDGKEGHTNAVATSEKPFDLNPAIVQSAPYAAYSAGTGLKISDDVTGVTNTTVNLFNSTTAEEPIFVIPTDDDVKVTIVYDVETYDPNVAGYLSDGVLKGSTIENKITKTISWDTASGAAAMDAGKKYTINLHLGMTSVKFDAFVTDWATGDDADTDLPKNRN